MHAILQIRHFSVSVQSATAEFSCSANIATLTVDDTEEATRRQGIVKQRVGEYRESRSDVEELVMGAPALRQL